MSVMTPVDNGELRGLVAATFSPFTPECEINLLVIDGYIDYLINKQGVRNIFVNGTTGESMSLTVAERKELAEEWCKKAKGRMDKVIVHVGCMSLKDSQDLARHAVEVEAGGIAVISPFFFKAKTADALRNYLQEVASVAPKMPFYYYHIPALTGVTVNARDVIKDIEKLIPAFSGVKFSGTDLMDFGQCVQYSQSNWSRLYGVDEQLIAGLAMGATGAVGSLYNYLGCQNNELMAAFGDGNLVKAREIQFKVQDLLSYAMTLGFDVGMNKQLMADVSGLSLGPPRLPVMQHNPDNAKLLKEKYKELFL